MSLGWLATCHPHPHYWGLQAQATTWPYLALTWEPGLTSVPTAFQGAAHASLKHAILLPQPSKSLSHLG